MREQLAHEPLTPRRRARPGSPHVVGVVSGRGGSGVSLVAALLALRSAMAGVRTLLVDADPWLDVQRIWLGLPKGPSLESLRTSDAGVESLITVVGGALELASLGSGEPADAGQRALTRRLPHAFESRGAVVVDAGSRLEGLERCVDLRVGSILVVSDVDAIALASTHALVKALRSRVEILPHVLFNRSSEEEARAASAVLGEGMRRFLEIEPPVVGYLPDDLVFRDRLAQGGALVAALADSSLPQLGLDLLRELPPWRSR